MQRGEVWWIHFAEPIGHRPAVLLSRNSAYSVRTHVTVAPLTRSARRVDSHVPVGPDDGIPQVSVVNLDDIQTVPMSRVEQLITTLSHVRMAEVDRAIKFALALK